MRNSIILSLTSVLVALNFTNAAATPTRVQYSDSNDTVAAKGNSQQRAAPSPRLHQTSWKEIQARKETRMKPLYRRQQASALPYPTCAVTNLNVPVARYPGVDIVGGDLGYSYRPDVFLDEDACLRFCQSLEGCVGYFYWPENQNCYPKAGWTSDMWTASSTAALRPGSVIGLVGGDCNSFNGGVPPAFRGTCCNAPATDNVDYRTCSNVVSWAEVARLNNVDLLGWDLDQEVPGTLVESEGQCVQNCLDTEGCTGYFYWPTAAEGQECFLKADGWSTEDFVTYNYPSMAAGSVAGIVGRTCEDLHDTLTDDVYQRCCNNN